MAGYDWISLTTDYGLSDGFVAACHGAIARIAPSVRVIDVTHLVQPADVARGAAVLAQAVPHLPPADPVVVVGDGWLEAEVLTVDRFGNVQLAAPGSTLDGLTGALRVSGMRAVRTNTFAEAGAGELIVYVDSADRVALAINGGRAVVALGVTPGDVLRISTT